MKKIDNEMQHKVMEQIADDKRQLRDIIATSNLSTVHAMCIEAVFNDLAETLENLVVNYTEGE